MTDPGTAAAIVERVGSAAGGLLVVGWTQERNETSYLARDLIADAVGLMHLVTWSTWDGGPWTADDDYAVVVMRRP